MLKLEVVTKNFGSFLAVKDISVHLKSGEFFGFLGPNGAGKTTTIKMICGLLAPTSGKILIDGIDLNKHPVDAKKLIGYIPDQPYLYDKLTGREFLLFSGGLYGLSGNKLKNKIEEVVSLLNISEWLSRRTEEYSQGMKQRVVIASAILHEPKLLLVDEPMIGLDPQSVLIVKNVFKSQAKLGTTIVMSTHSMHVAEEICNRIGVMKNGELIFNDSLSALNTFRDQEYSNLESFFIELVK